MPDEETKICTGCKIAKPLTEYYVHRSRPNSPPYARCKWCMNADSARRQREKRGYEAATKERIRVESETGLRECNICNTRLPLTSFYPTHLRCKKCNNQLQLDNQRKRRGLSATRERLLAEDETGMRTCTRCERTLPLVRHTLKYGQRVRQCADWINADMRYSYKKRTETDQEGLREQQKRNARKSRYGVTDDDYKRLVAEQGGRCALCSAEPTALTIDHCHKTGRVRGLLCNRCNTALGWLGDDADSAYRAFLYLSRTSDSETAS